MVKTIRDKKGKIIGVEDESTGRSREPTAAEILSDKAVPEKPFRKSSTTTATAAVTATRTPTPSTSGVSSNLAGGTFTGKGGAPSGIVTDRGTFLGLSPEDVEDVRQAEGIAETTPLSELQTGSEAELAKRSLEEAGAFDEVTPREVDIQAETPDILGGNLPLIGTSLQSINAVLLSAFNKGILTTLGEGDPITEESIREATLRQIRINATKEGISAAEGLGTVIEGIPVIGGLARKYANGLTQTPSGNADKVIGEINKIKEAASTGQEKVRNGLEDPEYGLGRAREMEEGISKLEGRLQLLINTSPILRANRDEVNLIQEQILEAREKVARYKKASSLGLTAQLTGTGRVIPTDEQMYFELKGGK